MTKKAFGVARGARAEKRRRPQLLYLTTFFAYVGAALVASSSNVRPYAAAAVLWLFLSARHCPSFLFSLPPAAYAGVTLSAQGSERTLTNELAALEGKLVAASDWMRTAWRTVRDALSTGLATPGLSVILWVVLGLLLCLLLAGACFGFVLPIARWCRGAFFIARRRLRSLEQAPDALIHGVRVILRGPPLGPLIKVSALRAWDFVRDVPAEAWARGILRLLVAETMKLAFLAGFLLAVGVLRVSTVASALDQHLLFLPFYYALLAWLGIAGLLGVKRVAVASAAAALIVLLFVGWERAFPSRGDRTVSEPGWFEGGQEAARRALRSLHGAPARDQDDARRSLVRELGSSG